VESYPQYEELFGLVRDHSLNELDEAELIHYFKFEFQPELINRENYGTFMKSVFKPENEKGSDTSLFQDYAPVHTKELGERRLDLQRIINSHHDRGATDIVGKEVEKTDAFVQLQSEFVTEIQRLSL
jgi:hypothetical protein